MGCSREEIREWIREGWSFRVKTVEGKKYITRRKGDTERGMGRYEPDLWRLIKRTRAEDPELSKRMKEQKERMIIIEGILGDIRWGEAAKTCTYILDGFCSFWRYEERQGFFNLVDNWLEEGYYRQIHEENGSSSWVFKAEQFYCKNCPAYKPEDNYLKVKLF